MQNKELFKKIEEAIETHYGKRCPDFEKGCITCEVWNFWDKLKQAEKEKQEQVEKVKKKIKKRRDFYTNLLKERGYKKGTIKALRINIIIEDHNRILEYIDKIFGEKENG